MNPSAPFIRRPVGTLLLSVGLFLSGVVAYFNLPVASLPNVDQPSIRINAVLPGANPETVAATIAAPLERRIGEISGVNELTSVSQLGSVSIQVQFDLSRTADDAARDVQAAINAAQADLPTTLTRRPTIRKSNQAAAPVLILAMTSPIRRPTDLYDLGDLIVSTRISQIAGVAEVIIGGAQTPAIRVVSDPAQLQTRSLGLEDVRTAITQANSLVPIGNIDGPDKSAVVMTNGQMELSRPQDYASLVVKVKNGDVVRIGDFSEVSNGTSNRLSGGWFNGDPAVIFIIFKTPDANVIETVDQINNLMPELHRLLPADVKISTINDRTKTIRASIADIQLTLVASIALVMLVVLIFLRRVVPTLAAGLAVPLSLAGTVGLMWFSGFSLDNISLLALTISVGFVVDDAIVTIENCYRNMEAGLRPLQAALEGARQIGFTIISISISLVAAFIPLLFWSGPIGRLFGEFAWTLTYAILISAVVSLTLTPMLCGRFIRRLPIPRETWLDRRIEPFFESLIRGYARSLNFALHHRFLMLLITATALGLTFQLYKVLPQGLVPQGDIGLVIGYAQVNPDVSYDRLADIQSRVTSIVASDPDVAGVGVSIGGTSGFGVSNQARFFVSLRPLGERKTPILGVIARLRNKLASIKGVEVTMFPGQEIQFSGRQSRSQYQVTLWSPELKDLLPWVPKVMERVKQVHGVVDVTLDRQIGAQQVNVVIDRVQAAKYGVAVKDIDNALNDTFSQRAVSTIYDNRNQYNVILEASLPVQRDLAGLESVFVKGNGGQQVPLSAVSRLEFGEAPLVVNHTGQFPAVTISFNTLPNVALGDVLPQILDIGRQLQIPESVHLELAGETLALRQQQSSELFLIITALIAVYLVLGILYEDLIHPFTILSTLPTAIFGALLTLHATGQGLSIITLIGIILLIGIVKKNGIMLVDFALDAERSQGLGSEDAIRQACLERFRPILMTTLAAMFGALPLMLAAGPGSELRMPLGYTVFGGLAVSQLFTIYTTPVIYLTLDRFRRKGKPADQGHASAHSRL